MSLLKYHTYEEARKGFKWSDAWDVFDGNPEHFNMAHECIDRHKDKGTAIRIRFEDGHSEKYTFAEISKLSSQFANLLESLGVVKGDRVAIMLDPCLEFYVCLFGTMKKGAIVVPCFQLFGPEALEHRIKDSQAKVLVTIQEKTNIVSEGLVPHLFVTGEGFIDLLKAQKDSYDADTTSGKDVAVYQYTSGTTRQFPEAIKHYHRSIVTLMPAAVFGRGLRPGDRYFCPSPPAWGHGLWHGTLSPLALGVAVGAYSGKFDVANLLNALEEFKIDNIGAMPTVYRMIKNSGLISNYKLNIKKMHYTGEPMDLDTFNFLKETFGVSPHSGYGSTEAGALIYHYAGFEGWRVKPGSLGKPMPGVEVSLLDDQGNEVKQGEIGEIALKRRGEWFRVKDAAYVDEDGYFWHKGRVDDIIISAGWTISPVEIEDVMKKHKAVKDVAVVGVPDKDRGQIIKGFVVTDAERTPELAKELQDFVRNQLSKHEYPREIVYLDKLPRTEAGKIKRNELKQSSL